MRERFEVEGTSSPVNTYEALVNPRYRSLDIWRGVACLMIVLLHAAFYAKCDDTAAARAQSPIAAHLVDIIYKMAIGVPMFFVISGYCIAATADSSRRKSRASLDYFERRLRRIFPPYWAVVGLTVLLSWLVAAAGQPTLLTNEGTPNTGTIPLPGSLSASQWFGNITLTEVWRFHFFGGPENRFLSPSWTLCYEEQFYVVCGLLLLLVPRRFFLGILAVSLATVGMLWLSAVSPAVHIDGFFFDGKWLMFAAGVFVYYHLNYCAQHGKKLVPTLLVLCVLGVFVGRFVLMRHTDDSPLKDMLYALCSAGAFAVAILFLRPLDARICGIKLLAPVALCGRMCYSLYLLHWPINKLVGHLLYNMGARGFWPVLTIIVPVVSVISIATSWVFYLLVERHFLNPPQTVAIERDVAPEPGPGSQPEPEPVGVPVFSGAGGAA